MPNKEHVANNLGSGATISPPARKPPGTLLLAVLLFVGVIAAAISPVQAQQERSRRTLSPRAAGPLVHTFSIVARDPQTGAMGAAVQSHWFAVGQNVIWAEAGVGAVATQSFIDPSYGPRGLFLMRTGTDAQHTLQALVAADLNNNVRQLGFIDAQGQAASWTGSKDISAAGSICGPAHVPSGSSSIPGRGTTSTAGGIGGEWCVGGDFAVQANLMSNANVWPAMAKAFQQAKGDLAERMLAALDAGQAAGGDIRGRQSAALIVVKAKSSRKPWEDRIFDVRVDDADYPLKELRRLVSLQRAYNHMNAGDAAVERKDNEAALREYSTAEELASKTEGVLPSRLAEMIYWHAVALVNMGRVEESLPLFKRVFQMMPSYRELTPRLPKSGLLVNDPEIVRRITSQ